MDDEEEEDDHKKVADTGIVKSVSLVRKDDRGVWLTVKWKGKDPATKKPWKDTVEHLPSLWKQDLPEAVRNTIKVAIKAYNASVSRSGRVVAADYDN